MSKIIAVASGKGGVGKSTFCANIALSLAKQKKKVLLVGETWLFFHYFSIKPRFLFQCVSPCFHFVCRAGRERAFASSPYYYFVFLLFINGGYCF